jgi:hypothetical protein
MKKKIKTNNVIVQSNADVSNTEVEHSEADHRNKILDYIVFKKHIPI